MSWSYVTLNVGGRQFQTTRATLEKAPPGPLREATEGSFFDRDPVCFRYVLQYLRLGKVVESALPTCQAELAALLLESDYFSLPELSAMIHGKMDALVPPNDARTANKRTQFLISISENGNTQTSANVPSSLEGLLPAYGEQPSPCRTMKIVEDWCSGHSYRISSLQRCEGTKDRWNNCIFVVVDPL